MFHTMPFEDSKDILKNVSISFSPKGGWELSAASSAVPYYVHAHVAVEMQRIFTCYVQETYRGLVISNIDVEKKPTSKELPFLDLMAYMMIDEAKEWTLAKGKKYLTMDTTLSFFVDHFVDEGFMLYKNYEVNDKSYYRGRLEVRNDREISFGSNV